jgi:hypothetical protein
MRKALYLALILCVGPVLAQEDKDLDLIPGTLNLPAPPAAAPVSGKLFLEDAASAADLRSPLAVPLPGRAEDWENRTSLDGRRQWRLSEDLRFDLSDRVSGFAQSHVDFPQHQSFRNDLREAYATWEPLAETYVELGRINLRIGEALGFNPVDFFKTRSAVALASLDPGAARENRLGAAMLRVQRVFDGGSFGLAIAPRLTNPQPLVTGAPPSLDPGFGRTNGENRFLLQGQADLGAQITPEILLFRSDRETLLGATLSRPVGEAMVLYGEWSGGHRDSLPEAALAFGRSVGTISPLALDPLGCGGGRYWRNQLALGGSWTVAAQELTINLEYHLNQDGFSQLDWRNWFAGQPANLLWYMRAYAADRQEPNSRHEFFLRADATNAFIRNLELSAFAVVNPEDGSVLAQWSASYYLSDSWTLGALVSANLGAKRSEHGSVPQEGGAVLQLVRYF